MYLPGGGSCSITRTMHDGRTAEIATIGSEGIIGSCVFFGDDLALGDTVVHIPGPEAYEMPVRPFMVEMERRAGFYDVVLRYSQALTNQVMQTVVCNSLHSAHERCCRWLLMTHDRIMTDDVTLTQEYLAVMLGIRRPTVTLILQDLKAASIIDQTRGYIRIVDRRALEGKACECYGSVKANFRRLLPEIAPAP